MPHRAVPSFTVEIKRARKPLVHTLTRKGIASEWDTRQRPKTLPFKDLFAATNPPSCPSLDSDATRKGPQASVGRILPSLASMDSLPVQEQQEMKESPARRRLARRVSDMVALTGALDSASGEGLTPSALIAESAPQIPVVQEALVVTSDPTDMPSGDVGEQRNTKSKGYWVAYRKAVRRGLPLPLLPAGKRWMRRLPPVCR